MEKTNSNHSVYDVSIRLLILLLLIVWSLFIMYPFLNIIVWSLILALALFPLHKSLSKKIGKKPKLASLIIVLTMFIIVVIPAGFVINSMVDEVKELKTNFRNDDLGIPLPKEKVKDWPLVGEKVYTIWQEASIDLKHTLIKYKDQLTEYGLTFFKGMMGSLSAILQIMIALIIASFLLTIEGIGESIRKFFRKIAGKEGDEFASISIITVGSVVKGVLGVAIIVGLLHGLIFTLAGVPFAGLWALLVFVLTVLQIPAIIVSLPIILYLFGAMDTSMAIAYTVALVIAGLSDNVLKPMLLGKGAPVPVLIIFIGVIGGFIFSGFIGLFTGAIVMSITYKLFVRWINS